MEQEGEVIVLTGSAIERRDLTTPAPLAIVDKAELEASGMVSVGDILQNLPSQSNAVNVQVNNGGDGSTRLNLRGLGAERTLVLVNGRRHVPGGTGANSSVDLNAIPVAIIERVEVLKDGASALYGSDAIGGVVNIITRSDFKGTEAAGYIGTTGDGLGTVYDLSLVTGHTTKRGNVVFAAGFYEQFEMGAGERGFSKADLNYNWMNGEVSTAGSPTTPEGTIFYETDDGVAGNDAWQQVRTDCPSGMCFRDPARDAPWRDFADTGNRDVGEGDLYNFQPENYLITPQQRYNIFSTGNYQLHDRVRTFFEASYTNRRSDQQLAPEPVSTAREGLIVSANNIYNPFGRDFGGGDGADIHRRFVEAGPRRFLQDVDTFRFVGGLDGKLPDQLLGWRWSAALNYGRTESTEVNEGRLIRSRFQSAVGPSFLDEDGVARCGTPDNVVAGCVPLNLFGGEGTISQDMIDYLTYTGIAKGLNEQTSLLLNTSGRIFKTPWGGDVALAVGAEYRTENGANIPDPRTAVGDTTGNKSDPTEGGFDVYEAYTELSVVPVVGKQLAEWVEVSAAARAFHVTSPGLDPDTDDDDKTSTDFTWKLGGLWRMIKGVSVRGTYSTAFRAPSIAELFAGTADAFPRVSDPCDTSMARANPVVDANCRADGLPDDFRDTRAQLLTRVGSNPELDPETANIFTVGAVYEPTFVPGLAFTLDYFNTKIKNAIQPYTAAVILANCYTQTNRDDCEKIQRDPTTNRITVINDQESNIGGAETAGVDFNIRYDHTTPVGRFRHNLEGTWLQHYDEIYGDGATARRVEGKGVYDLGLYPDWKLNFATSWGLNEWGAGINLRFINGITECQNNTCNVEMGQALNREVDANVTGDIFGSYTLKSSAGTSRVTVGVNNVLDQDPAVIYNGFLANSDTDYDFLGRFFYTRFVQQF